MARADLSAPRRVRVGVVAGVALLHLLAVLALIRAFAPDFAQEVTRQMTRAFSVTVTTPPPSPSSTPQASDAAGAAAEAGKRAQPREAAAPPPKLVLANPSPAAPVAGKGSDNTSGARDAGQGTGAGGQGSGTGRGAGGDGQGGGAATRPVMIAGGINSARDYPRESRELRIGGQAIVLLTVGTDGRVTACRVHRASRDAEADRITCRLAIQRFRFRPATDARGNPVEATFGWQQRWFYPSENK